MPTCLPFHRVQVVAHAVLEADTANAALERQVRELFDLLQARPEELGPDARPSSATERDKARQQLQELLRSQRRALRDLTGGTNVAL